MRQGICFPRYSGGQFDDLQSAVDDICRTEADRLGYYLADIVVYNVRYRDVLRSEGFDRLADLLRSEAPVLNDHAAAFHDLKQQLDRYGHLADYDIQCYHIRENFQVLGFTLAGLQEVRHLTDMIGLERGGELRFTDYREPRETIHGLHVGAIFQPYPQFDSYDAGDNRAYYNYILRRHDISTNDFRTLISIPMDMNTLRVHERLSKSCLPVLYYGGRGNYMLLATKKN